MAEMMRKDHLGDLIVVEHRSGEPLPIGIVTDRDLVTRVLAMELDATQVTASEIMSRPLVTAYEGEELLVAFERLKKSHVRRIPLLDSGGVLVGIVSMDDIAGLLDLTLPGKPPPVSSEPAKTAV
jgi:CBS domain-containing protein